MYFVAAPGTVVMFVVVPLLPPVVPVTVVTVPETVWLVNTTVAIPLPLVVEVPEAKEPFASDFVHVTTWPLVRTELLFASASWAEIVAVPPAVGL